MSPEIFRTPETNYVEVDQGTLAVVFGVQKFHHFLARRHFP